MGNPMSEFHGWYSSDEEDDRRRRRNSSENRRRGRKSGRDSSRRRNLLDEKWDDRLDLFNDMTSFGFRRANERLGFGFDKDMERIIHQAGASRSNDGAFSSTQIFSSVTTIGEDGVPVSESRGVSTNSNGKYKMAHQHRIGDRSQTLMRERKSEHEEFQESQRLYEITHDELPEFRSEFNDRTKQWRSRRAIKEREMPRWAVEDPQWSRLAFDDRRRPRLALEDGRRSREVHSSSHSRPFSSRSRVVHSSSHSRPVSSQNYRRQPENYKYRPRGREY